MTANQEPARVYLRVSRTTTTVSESIEYELTGGDPMSTSADTNPDWAGDEAQRNDRSRSHAGATRHVSDGVHGNGDND